MNTGERGSFDSLTEGVLGAVLDAANTLGAGFLEKGYEGALLRELALRGIRATSQTAFPLIDNGAGEYSVDLLIEDVLVVELKCVARFADEHAAQCPNTLQASLRSLSLLVNFQKSAVESKPIAHGF